MGSIPPKPNLLRSAPHSGAEERLFSAEKNIAIVRLAVIVFNLVAYWTLLAPQGVPWLAALISVVALVYAVYVILGAPYRLYPVMLTGAWTAGTDGTLILLWIHATGDYSSPFHLLWYLSLVAVTFRFDWRAILITASSYAAAYTLLLWATDTLAGHETEVMVRGVYLLLQGSLGALLARESLQLFEERFALRQRMQQMELERLKEVDRFKTDFINTAAHELNTPLTPLLLQVHMLSRATPAQSPQRASIDVLDRNLNRLSQLVQDMLDVARLQGGRLRLEPRPWDLRTLLAEAADTFRDAAHARSITLDVAPGEPLMAPVDARRIAQALHNLVSNAIKFTPPGGRVTLEAFAEGGHAVLRVADSGIGLTASQAGQLFQPFSRQHRDQVDVPGTGLGLYISRGFAEWHGGTLEAQSAGPGQGTTFTVRLPLEPAATEPGPPLARPSTPSASPPAKAPSTPPGTPPSEP